MSYSNFAMVLTSLLFMPSLAMGQALPPEEESSPPKETPSQENIVAARQHFRDGKKAHDAKNYELAAKEYLRAYEIYPQPLFIYNVAQVKRLAGDKAAAVEYYDKYLVLDPRGRGASNTKELLKELRAQIELEERDAKEEPPNTSDTAKPPPDIVAPKDTKAIVPIAIVVDPQKPKTNPGRGYRIAGLTSAGVGLVSLGVSAYFGSQASSKQDEISSFTGTWTNKEQALYDDGESAKNWAQLSAAVGVTAISAGAVLYFLGSRKGSSAESLTVIPSTTAKGASISLLGHF